MTSAGIGGIVHGHLQMLHVHVFLVAPLGARHMAKPRADQHQSGVFVGKCPYHTGSAADPTVQPLNHIVGADVRPMLAWKIAVSQRLLDLPAASFSFIALSSATTAFAFSWEAFPLSCAWIILSMLAAILTLDSGTTEKNCGKMHPSQRCGAASCEEFRKAPLRMRNMRY